MSDDEILAALEEQFQDTETPDVRPMSDWTPIELIDRLEALDAALVARGELLEVETQEAREMHSERGAIIIQMKERGLR